MCRLAAYQGIPLYLEDLISVPGHSLVEQSQAAREAKMSVNGDGFGFAWYGQKNEPGLYRDVTPAWANENLRSLARMVKAPIILAHVRASTYGQVAQSNCHPFVYKNWSFMHNGQIGNFEHHKRQLEAVLPDQLYVKRTGTTDSELLFLLLIAYGVEYNPEQAVQKLISTLQSLGGESCAPHRLSIVMSDGKQLYAFRWSSDTKSPSLYLSAASSTQRFIVSEPFDSHCHIWEPMEEGVFLQQSDQIVIGNAV